MVRHPVQWNPLLYRAITFYVEMPRISGTGFLVKYTFSILSRGLQVWKFRAVDDNQLKLVQRSGFEGLDIRQGIDDDLGMMWQK